MWLNSNISLFICISTRIYTRTCTCDYDCDYDHICDGTHAYLNLKTILSSALILDLSQTTL